MNNWLIRALPGVQKIVSLFDWSAFTFSESSYFNLKFGIKQSEIGWKFAEQCLPKARILGPADDRRPDFFGKDTNLKQPYCFIKVHWNVQIS